MFWGGGGGGGKHLWLVTTPMSSLPASTITTARLNTPSVNSLSFLLQFNSVRYHVVTYIDMRYEIWDERYGHQPYNLDKQERVHTRCQGSSVVSVSMLHFIACFVLTGDCWSNWESDWHIIVFRLLIKLDTPHYNTPTLQSDVMTVAGGESLEHQ